MEAPEWDDFGLPEIDHYRFRVGAWECGRGACRFDREVPVAIVFTKPTPVSEHVVTEIMFGFLYRDGDFDQPREDEEGICWLFSRLYWLLTDWQNIISEIVTRLDEAEANSHGRHLPVKTRTRLLHSEVDRMYELKEYLHFHSRAFKKLQKLKMDVPKNEQKDPLWGEMDDAVEDLEQYDSTLDSLKERKCFGRRLCADVTADILQASTISSSSNSTSRTPCNPTTHNSSPLSPRSSCRYRTSHRSSASQQSPGSRSGTSGPRSQLSSSQSCSRCSSRGA